MASSKYTRTTWVNGGAPAVSATNLNNIETGILNAIGTNVLASQTSGTKNTGTGEYCLSSVTNGSNNSGYGYYALSSLTTGGGNTAIGDYALKNGTSSNYNTAIGVSALRDNTSSYCTAIGYFSNRTGTNSENNSFGSLSCFNLTSGSANCAFGNDSLYTLTTGSYNSGFGNGAIGSTTASTASSAIGYSALGAQTTGYRNTALGYLSLQLLTTYYNCTGLGAGSAVTNNNQVQLGDSATTAYAYGAVQDRSDERDKAEIRDTILGLSFINQLRPVDFKWNYREDYKDQENDGSKTRSRFHHGLIAQEVAELIASTGVDFGGYQDHSFNGGQDVKSIGYTELIAPLIKSVQELSARIEILEAQLGGG